MVFNIEPGANLVLQMDHPECEQAPFPLVSEGRTYTGKTIVNAAEPGDFNSAVVLFFK